MATKRTVNIFINGRQVENTLKSIYSEKRKINSELNNMTVGSAEYIAKAKELRQVNGILDTHRQKIGQTSGTYDKITGGLTKFAGIAGIAFGVGEVIQYGKRLFDLGAEMELLGKKATTVFAQALPAVTREAEANATAMGLTTSEYIDQAAAIADLLIPMGFQREEAAGLSTNLVSLSGALSEWTGGQITAEEVSKTLSKAMLGEREELKQLGISISEADVQARLQEKGLEKLTGTLLQQAKAIATVELITEKSTDAQTAYTENADTMVRRQAVLSAKISEVQEKLATLLIPVFERLVSAVEMGADALGFIMQQFDGAGAGAKRLVDSIAEQEKAFNSLQSELDPLLTRYDQLKAKTVLTTDEQTELTKIIARVAELTPTAITEIDKYGNALDISSGKSRAFLESEKARLEFINQDAIESITSEIESLSFAKERIDLALKRGSRGAFSIALSPDEVRRLTDEFGDLERQIEGASAELARLQGGNLGAEAASDPQADAAAAAREAAAQAALEAAAQREADLDAQKKAYEKLQKERRAHLEKLAEIIAEANEENYLNSLSESERELEVIRLKYQKQIDLAAELERAGYTKATAQRVELERLRDEELEAAQLARDQARRERELEAEEAQLVEDLERRRLNEERRQELETEINEKIQEVVLSERELAIVQLEEEYTALLAQAKLYGIDTFELEVARRKQLAALNAEFDKKALDADKAQQDARIASAKAAYGALSDAVGTFYSNVLNEQERATGAGKLLALINIGVNAAEALSSAAAASAGVPFPGNLAAIASSVATVLSIIGQARAALNATPDVPQRKDGGYVTVRGEEDKKTYRAKRIGRPGTGYLPDYPVLIDSVTGASVLGSENGSEYFVSNPDLQNPKVMRHVAAIEAIRQRVDGGFSSSDRTAPASAPAGSAPEMGLDASVVAQLVGAVVQLTNVLERGIPAILSDDLVVDVNRRFQEINEASGGILN